MSEMETLINKVGRVDYFKSLKSVLRALGLSLAENESTVYKIYSTIVLILCYTYGFVTFYEIFKNKFDTLVETLFIQFAIFITLVKVLAILRKRVNIRRILDTLEKEPFLPNSERGNAEVEEELINKCVWFTKMQERVYIVVGYVTIAISIAVTLRNRITSSDHNDWELPFHPISSVNVTYSPNYEIFCSYQIAIISFFVGFFIIIDLTTAAILAHISYQFKMVQNNIRNIMMLSYKDMLKDSNEPDKGKGIDPCVIPWKYLQKNLANAVQYHLSIINIAEEFEDVFSGLLLVVFISSLGLISLMIYHLSLLSIHDHQMYMATLEFLGASMQTFLICYWGEQVLIESQLVGQSAYEINFVGADLRFQKALILIIRRSQNPTIITANKFVVFNLSTFAWIFEKSYSAYAVLQKTNFNE